VNELQRAIHRYLTTELDRPLKDKITASEAQRIVFTVERFILSYGFKRDIKEDEASSQDFMKEIEKI